MTVVPMFPLGSVLLPGGVLPLHVFEPRYRQLVRDCVEAADHEFGVVLIERGSEVGGGDVRRPIGTVARMVQVAQVADGRYAVVAVGVRRLRVRRWLDDDPYPRAEIETWDEEPGEPDEAALTGVLTQLRRCVAMATELGDAAADPTGLDRSALGEDPAQATYRLAGSAPLGSADLYHLLEQPGPVARLSELARMLDDLADVLAFRLGAGAPPGRPGGPGGEPPG